MISITFLLFLIIGTSNAQFQNVALQGRATQSTNDGWLSTGQNAIDGNTDSEYLHGSCFSTTFALSPWWRLDLLKSYKISHITITKRNCCAHFIDGAEILIGDSLANNGNNNPRCAVSSTGGAETYQCNGMKGRYVNVGLPGRWGYLTFCEVQVFVSQEESETIKTKNNAVQVIVSASANANSQSTAQQQRSVPNRRRGQRSPNH
ncbi:fucolectin-like isoform X1 [Engystomops pustulosus]|uniref:fucolectin-like isoform X1 n=1 Tax=Engystomops pustulosus TaxID=76066 RepID=UPI003AFA4CE0